MDEDKIKEKYGETHYINKLFKLEIDLRDLNDNQAVVYGDGKSYCWLIEKKEA